MNKLIDRLYFLSPSILQTIFVSLYGFKLYRQRFGKDSRAHLKTLLANEKLSREEIENLQDKIFSSIIKHAALHVPFYKSFFKNSGLSFTDVNSFSKIENLPIVTKDMIKANPLDFCAKNYVNRRDTFWLSTSGTSGKPMSIFCDNESRQNHYVFWSRFRKWCRLPDNACRATFFGRTVIDPNKNIPPFYRLDYFGKNYLFSSYHLKNDNLLHYYNELRKINPDELIGYPSSLHLIAKFCKENNLLGIRPLAIITTAETLLDNQRSLLEEVFQCPIYDQYGCTEMAIFVSQCEAACYHVHPEHGYLEILNNENKRIKSGETGRCVCTGFVNYAMPLIRYDLGDIVRASDKPCSCGRAFQVIEEIVGRVDDVLFKSDGTPLPRLTSVFKNLKGVYESQIVQENFDSLQINLVTDNSFTLSQKCDLEYELRKRVGSTIHLTINKVEYIPKAKNGKFKTVISQIKKG